MPKSLLAEPTVYGSRAKLGVIVPPTNTANEAEWNQMVPVDISIHAARMPLHTDTTSDAGRAALYADIERYAADLAQASVDVIAYGCTAGSMVKPVTALADYMREKTGINAVTTAQAIVEALQTLNVQRIAVATPYHAALNQHEQHFLSSYDFDVVAIEGLGYGENGPQEYRNIARIKAPTVIDLVRRVNSDHTQAILISCTDLASLAVIAKLEEELGKPVLSSNTATFWAALRAAGIKEAITGYGTLLEHH